MILFHIRKGEYWDVTIKKNLYACNFAIKHETIENIELLAELIRNNNENDGNIISHTILQDKNKKIIWQYNKLYINASHEKSVNFFKDNFETIMEVAKGREILYFLETLLDVLNFSISPELHKKILTKNKLITIIKDEDEAIFELDLSQINSKSSL